MMNACVRQVTLISDEALFDFRAALPLRIISGHSLIRAITEIAGLSLSVTCMSVRGTALGMRRNNTMSRPRGGESSKGLYGHLSRFSTHLRSFAISRSRTRAEIDRSINGNCYCGTALADLDDAGKQQEKRFNHNAGAQYKDCLCKA
jgi:hypothetical protein